MANTTGATSEFVAAGKHKTVADKFDKLFRIRTMKLVLLVLTA